MAIPISAEVQAALVDIESLDPDDLVNLLKGIGTIQVERYSSKFAMSRDLREAFETVGRDSCAKLYNVIDTLAPTKEVRLAYYTNKSGQPCQSVTIHTEKRGPWKLAVTATRDD